jgi:foldase protein PrsA
MRTFFWTAATLMAVTVSAQGIDLSKPVVVVNGQPISYGTYYKRMEGLQGFGRRVGQNFVPASPGFLTLQQLINEALIVELALDKGVAPTEAEINAEYQSMMQADPERAQEILKFATEEEVRRQIRIQLSEFKLQTMGINIGDQQVEAFYKEHPTMYTTPKTIDLYAIAVETPDQQDAVDKKLAAKAPFADVAKELSLDLTKSIGGFIGRVVESGLPDRIRTKVESLKEGETTTWVDADALKYKYYVGKVFSEKLSPLTPDLRKAIRQRLMVDRGATKNDLNKMMKEKRASLKLDFKGTPFDDQLKEAFSGG